MKVYLVTSSVTYIPNNYYDLFEGLLRENSSLIAGIIILKNLDFSLFKQVIGLPVLGAPKLCGQLCKNILSLKSDPRVKLFQHHHKEVHYLDSMNGSLAQKLLKKLAPDLLINARTRCIYKKKTLAIPSLGCLNIHHGILPQYRGTLCDLYALSENRAAGFSIHKMNAKIDDGEIYHTQEVSQGDLHYLDYLAKTPFQEAQALNQLLKEIETHKKLPQGRPNQTPEVTMTSTPSRSTIAEFKKRGMIL